MEQPDDSGSDQRDCDREQSISRIAHRGLQIIERIGLLLGWCAKPRNADCKSAIPGRVSPHPVPGFMSLLD
jgi:hypothetical protein